MRRLSRLVDALGSPVGLSVLAALLEGPANQEDLKGALASAGVPVTQATLSGLMTRFEDLGLVERDNRKAPYRLRHPDAVAGALLHLAALGLEMASKEHDETEALEALSRKARVHPLEQDADDAETM
jgi:DNA-binding transcriptional ArsR family regulator